MLAHCRRTEEVTPRLTAKVLEVEGGGTHSVFAVSCQYEERHVAVQARVYEVARHAIDGIREGILS